MRFIASLKSFALSIVLFFLMTMTIAPSWANDSYITDDEKTPEWKTPAFISSFIGVITSGKLQNTAGDILTEPENPIITKQVPQKSPNAEVKPQVTPELAQPATKITPLPAVEQPQKEATSQRAPEKQTQTIPALSHKEQSSTASQLTTQHNPQNSECDYITQTLHENPKNADDYVELAPYYLYGHCVTKNTYKAFKYFKQAAFLGDTRAMHRLGLMYYSGTGVKANLKESEKWLKKAAAKQHSPSQKALVYLHKNQSPLSKTVTQLTTQTQGLQTFPGYESFHAPYQQALNLYNASSQKKDREQAVSEFKRLSSEGYAPAQYTLGYLLLKGESIAHNPVLAKEWFIKAANQGEVRATSSLGYLYLTGIGVSQNFQEALRWFTKAANLNDPYAQDQLGLMYCKGQGTEVNFTHAIAWYRCAARQNYVPAQFHLALLMFSANTPVDDPTEAESWLKKAADNGHTESQNIYAGLLYTGSHNVSRDVEKSIEYFKRAAAAGHAESHYLLGTIYVAGNGVLKDYVQARKWFNSAAKLNHPDADRALAALDKLEKQATSQNKTKAMQTQQQIKASEVVQSHKQTSDYEDELAQ